MGRTRSNKQFGNTDTAPKLEFKKCQSQRGSTNPACIHFGVGSKRLILYPTGYFCSNCKSYEDHISSGGGKKIKCDGQKYAC